METTPISSPYAGQSKGFITKKVMHQRPAPEPNPSEPDSVTNAIQVSDEELANQRQAALEKLNDYERWALDIKNPDTLAYYKVLFPNGHPNVVERYFPKPQKRKGIIEMDPELMKLIEDYMEKRRNGNVSSDDSIFDEEKENKKLCLTEEEANYYKKDTSKDKVLESNIQIKEKNAQIHEEVLLAATEEDDEVNTSIVNSKQSDKGKQHVTQEVKSKDTLKSPPSEKVTMKKASTIAITITTIFYLCCGGFGYAAFGDSTPGNILTGFYEPYWLVDFAHACIIIHLVGAFQVFSQSLFADLEGVISSKLPNSKFVNHSYILRVPLLSDFRLNLLRVCFRTSYVVLITGIAITFPYFNQVVGFAGALCFWPIVIYFPTEMYIAQKNIEAWTRKWIILHIYVVVFLLVSLFAFAGSIEGIITAKFG